MKLPLTDLFGYVYNWQTWVNKEENWFYTISGLAVLFILLAGSSCFILCGIFDRLSSGTINHDDIFNVSFVIVAILLSYIYLAFIIKKRYKSFVYDEKYIGRRARMRVLRILIITMIYTIIGFLSPCYLWL